MHLRTILLQSVFWISLASCSNRASVVHERRAQHRSPEHALERSRLESDAVLPMRIGLAQNQFALSNAEQWLMDVSDPISANFGWHWTQDAVTEAFRPADETIEAIKEWLQTHGVSDITLSDNKQWLAFDIAAGKAEQMLNTQYFEDVVKGKTGDIVGFEASANFYSLPVHLTKHVDFVKPGLQGIDVTGRTTRSRRHLQALGRSL